MLVKICGITRLEDALAAAEAGADAVGFNFWPSGQRYVTPERAAEIATALPASVRRVGVFVDEAPEAVGKIASSAKLDVLQFHGLETAKYMQAFPWTTWKVIHMTPAWSPVGLPAFSKCEAFLLDNAGTTPGGTGRKFDWTRAVAAKKYGRVILAGGLTPVNVADAVRAVQPWGVDVASGVEDSPGIKNHALVRDFVRAAREAGTQLEEIA